MAHILQFVFLSFCFLLGFTSAVSLILAAYHATRYFLLKENHYIRKQALVKEVSLQKQRQKGALLKHLPSTAYQVAYLTLQIEDSLGNFREVKPKKAFDNRFCTGQKVNIYFKPGYLSDLKIDPWKEEARNAKIFAVGALVCGLSCVLLFRLFA